MAPAQALGRLGVRLCIQARHADAVAVLQAAAGLTPGDPALLNNFAVALDRCGRSAEAVEVVGQSLALEQAQPDSWLFLANMKGALGDSTGALAAYEAAIALQPESPLAWQGAALIHQQRRNFTRALECLITSLRQCHPTPPLLAILGQLFYETGQFEKSRVAYAAALESEPRNPVYRRMQREIRLLCAALLNQSLDEALDALRIDCADCPDPGDKDAAELLKITFSLLAAHGKTAAARCVAQKRLTLFPTATAAYLLQAVSGQCADTPNEPAPARSPDAYLVESFNAFADRFDQHLVATLGYDIPEKLVAALAGIVTNGARLDVLDAGCGTGLCGPHLRPWARSLTGVDLAPRMLDHAAGRGLYDRLICRELTAFLNDSPLHFDLVVAADVFIYFGDLVPLAAALAATLRPGGLLAFSTERSAAPGQRLQTSGRFAHHPDYVHSIFAPAFVPRLCHETTIRQEAARPVAGNLYVFQRR